MFKNYLAISLRNIRQNPLYAFINIFSLAIGLAACLVIYLFITDESSFDAFHAKNESIYRLDEVQNFPGTNEQKVALSMPGMGPAFLKDFPEVANFTRFVNRGNQLVIKGENRLIIPSIAYVDSTYLEIFDFEVLQGDRNTALDEPYVMMVTEETALKFFPSVDQAMNNTLTWRDKEYKITGILKEVPENSHMQFDALASVATIVTEDNEFNDRWGGNSLNTYFVLHPGTDIPALESKFPAFMSRHMDDPDINKFYKLYLQPLNQVHLESIDIEHDYNNYRKFNGSYLDVFYVIALFILLIAAVNFMNLTTARASHRWKEIGVRKTVGAKKLQLFSQFIFESVLLALFALVLAVLLDLLFVPLLNSVIGRQLSMNLFFENYLNILLVVAATLVLGFLTGIYPSFYMTSFNMARVLKGGGKGEGRSLFRSGLVVVQFGLALAMIVSTLIVVQQLSYMKNADIGFNKDQIMLVDMNREANEKFETMKQELLKNSLVKGVTASGQRLGNNFHQWGFKVKADTGVMEITPSNVNVDYDYLKVYGIQLAEGRDFSKDNASDNGRSFIINETFAKELGLKETVGTPAGHGWYHNDSLGTIIGVVKDFNFNSLHYKVNTLEMVVHPEWGYDELSVKIDGARTEEAIALVKGIWEQQITSYPFEYSFLDQHFEKLYQSDKQMSAVVTVMAGLAILISCMGLFGLAAITTEKKTKEIGIRKALGASETQITLLLSRNFAWLIVLSFIIVCPITYYLLSGWLENFAYRIGINPFLFLLGGAIAMAIALLTISFHTLRSARANPVNALRYE
ncbi:MAG TPA: ABC transporter permease [Cyclobacteriaceae bacterium]|nr:ABC transporter permease [Cyclobacteriaceae bacterium]